MPSNEACHVLDFGWHMFVSDSFLSLFLILKSPSIHFSLCLLTSKTNCSGYSLSSGSSYHQEKQQNAVNYNDKDENQEDNYISNHYEEKEETPLPEFKLAHFLRGWLSCTRLWGLSRRGSEGRSHPPRFTLQSLGGWSTMIAERDRIE